MSEYGSDGTLTKKEKDPLLRFLGGCAIVLGALAAIVIGGCGFVAWRLVRDETPGRPVETMLLGDESRFWCADLKPDDAGIVAMVARMDSMNDETRRRLINHTFLRGIPLPSRKSQIDVLLPLRLEVALVNPDGWAGRATLSKGSFKLRAALKVMRFALSRSHKDSKGDNIVDVDGVKVSILREREGDVALATVGNRVLVADGVERMRRMLTTLEGAPAPALAGIGEFHDSIRLDGEDAWAFASATQVEGPTRPLPLLGAVASFDLAPDDALRFRVEVPAEDGAGLAKLTSEEARAIAASFLPHFPADAITLDPAAPTREGHAWRIDGRIPELSQRLRKLFAFVSDSEEPSANPPEPSPPPTSGRRTDTPAASKREGTPTPAH